MLVEYVKDNYFSRFHDPSYHRYRERHFSIREILTKSTRFDIYETLCPQQMLVHKGGQIKNWSGECRDVIPTKLQCQAIQRALQSLQREIIRKK